jgi:hypothetical protein
MNGARHAWLLCRLYASIGRVALDAGAVITQRRIQLTTQPAGRARVVFTAQDFDRFLQHPFMVNALARALPVRGRRWGD